MTVTAAEDADAVTDADVTLAHAISSTADTAYDALTDQSVTVSITENDAVTVAFEKEIHYTNEGASGVAGVEVLLSAPLQTEVTIPITVLSQSTAGPEDYLVDDSAGLASDPGLTFSPGETFGYVFIEAVLDTVDEDTETVVLGFGTLPAGVSEGSPSRSTVMIDDDEGAPTCPPTLESAVVDGRTVTLTFTAPMALVEPPSDPDHPDYEERPNPPEHFFTLFEGWPEPTDSNIGSDSYRVNYGTLARTFSLNGPVVTLTFPDTIRTDSKVWVRYDKFSRYAPLGPSTSEGCNDRRGVASFITELDDSDNTGGTTPLPALTISGGEGREGVNRNIAFTVTLIPASTETVVVDYRTVARTATAGEDFTATSGTLTFAPGDTSKIVRVPIIDDSVEDDGETFLLDILDASGATMSDTESWATGTIHNREDEPTGNENQLTASFANVPAEHGGPGENNRFTFDLSLSEAPASLSYKTLRDHAFSVTGGDVKKAKRKTKGSNQHWTIHVEPSGWGQVAVTLPATTSCSASGAVCTSDGRMLSNAPSATIRGPAALSVADASANENSDAGLNFVVSLDRVSTLTISVDYATSDGTATAGQDYTATSGTLTFHPGDAAKTVSVPVLDDVVDDGGETVTLTLSNATNARIADATATGTIENSDPLPAAWLVRFGRTSATQVVGLLDDRFDEAATPASQLILGGQSWRLSALRDGLQRPARPDQPTEADRADGVADRAAGDLSPPRQDVDVHTATSPGLTGTGGALPGETPGSWSGLSAAADGAATGGAPQGVTPGAEASLLERTVWGLLTGGIWSQDRREFLSRSGFNLSLTDLGNDPDESIETVAATPDVPGHWSLWGRGALTHFGGVDDGVSLDGDVLTGLLGVDYTRERWLAGVALAYHDGDGTYRSPGSAGELNSALVSVNPYLRYALTDRLSVWGALGYGQGTLTLRPARVTAAGDGLGTGDGLKSVPGESGDSGVSGVSGESESIETAMQMGMGALGLRGTVYASERTELVLKSDALWVRTASADAPGLRAVDNADTSRVRLLLSGRHQRALANDAVLTPTVELGLRYDDGDAERGFGMELGGGLRYADPVRGLTLETRARALLAHEDGGYEEWGVGGSLALDPGRLGRGLALRLDSGWGITDSGTDALWQRQSTAGLARQHDAPAQGRIRAEMGYGLDVPYSYGLLTPYGSVELAGGGSRTLRLGWRFELGQRLSLSLAGERRETALARPEHGLMLRTSLPW